MKVAEANYDKAHERFMEKAMELSARKFESRTQYKTKIIELDNPKEEMIKYADQIAQVKESPGKDFKAGSGRES